MDLGQKIERSKTCIHFNLRKAGSGNCNLGGYAPLDCGNCTSYKLAPEFDKAPLLNPDFWDCECDEHYIHTATQEACPICDARRDEMPDSRQSEIDEGTHLYGGA